MKRTKIFSVLIKFIAALMCGVMLLATFVGCSDKYKSREKETTADTSPVIECDGVEIPLFFYEFMLSRVKGNLARDGHKVTTPDFWYAEIEGDGRTVEEFYNSYVLDLCKNYLAAIILFEREELTLPESTFASIDEEVQYYIDYDGDGDEEAFNALIRKFGIDAEALRRCYIIEAKYDYLMSYLYGGGQLIGDVLREDYYREYYYSFKQILIRKYKYEFETDEEGNIIYFDSTGKPIYDTKNGVVDYNDDGSRVTDKYGQSIYYDLSSGKILYDVQNGKPAEKLDSRGNPIKTEYTEIELAERRELANEILDKIAKGDFGAFESKLNEIHGQEMIFEDSSESYFVSRIEEENYLEYPYIKLILAELEGMSVGDVAIVESNEGYHIIMKYDLEDEKYNDTQSSEWFSNLDSKIILDLFKKRTTDVFPNIKENTDNIAKARSITRVGINYDY